jgi:hypothetical protein
MGTTVRVGIGGFVVPTVFLGHFNEFIKVIKRTPPSSGEGFPSVPLLRDAGVCFGINDFCASVTPRATNWFLFNQCLEVQM